MTRIMPTVGRLAEEDIPGALRISLKELGADYLDGSDFRETLGSEDSFCMVARDGDGAVIGFSICHVFGPDELDERLRLPDGPERRLLESKRLIGLFDSVSVDDRHKGRGVGTMLFERCTDTFAEKGVEALVAMGWEDRSGHCNIGRMLVTMGMTPSYAIKGYWNQFVESPEGHMCPTCGRPCTCSGRLFYKVL